MTMTTGDQGQLNFREQIARIDGSIAESAKLQEETRKFVAEGAKLQAELSKLERERRWFPWLQLAASPIIAAVVAHYIKG
jgi:hypothetical protein